jgi:hypothetical protein
MLNAIVIAIRFIILAFSGHKQVALENVGLRQQLAVIQARREASQIAQSRPIVLGRPEDDLEGLEVSTNKSFAPIP